MTMTPRALPAWQIPEIGRKKSSTINNDTVRVYKLDLGISALGLVLPYGPEVDRKWQK
mgnify:CR=1 FL=1